MTPNWFATIALLAWPLVAFSLYLTRPTNLATLWTILGAYVLLPVGTFIKFDMVPLLDKQSIPSFCALVGCIATAGWASKRRNTLGIAEFLTLGFVIGPFISSQLNADAIDVGGRILPGVGLYDAISAFESACITLIPFVLGRRYLRSTSDLIQILRILVVVGLLYSFPMFFEMRFSPQLHNWIYGYFPTNFQQSMREDGYRPMVFMGHGLLASFLLMTTVVASAALWQLRHSVWRLPPHAITAYLSFVLLLCKSAAATFYGVVLVALIKLSSPRSQIRVAVVLVVLAWTYPLLRAWDVFPTRFIVQIAGSFSSERAASMEYRFKNEDMLLARASQRWLFGWGRYGRSRVYDPNNGDDLAVTDGRWIQTLGDFGVFGFLAEFGLLGWCVIRASMAMAREGKDDQIVMSALALIIAANIIDLLPNSSLRPWTWLLCGALLGRADEIKAIRRFRSFRRHSTTEPANNTIRKADQASVMQTHVRAKNLPRA